MKSNHYHARHSPRRPYIVFNDLPKVENLKRLFPAYYRKAPVTVLASSKQTQ